MKSLKINIPIILLFLFEVAVGILLLMNPEAFTRMLIILFGIIFLVIGIIYLIRYLREKNDNIINPGSLLIAVIALIIGVVCSFFTNAIIGLITAIAIVYGVILAISGIYKLYYYFQIKKSGIPVSMLSAASGVIAVIIGLVIAVYPKSAALSVWQAAGILLIIEAVIDFLSVIQVVRDK